MNPVSDGFLFTDAQIAATLLGLLLLGGFFYLESGFRDAGTVKAQGAPFLRATTKFTMLLYALVVSIALGLVVLRPIWVLSIYAVLSLGLIRALLEWTRRYRELGATLPCPSPETRRGSHGRQPCSYSCCRLSWTAGNPAVRR